MLHDNMIRARGGDILSIHEMRSRLPAIFAAEPHERCSNRYTHIPTIDTIEALIDSGFEVVEARYARTKDLVRRSHAKHMVKLRHRSLLRSNVSGDAFEVVLKNAHDGSSQWLMLAGFFRFICENGLVVGDYEALKIRHVGDRQEHIARVVVAAHQVIESAPRLIEAKQNWATIELNRDERMALANSAHHLRFADADGNVSTGIKPEQLLLPRRPDDQKPDLWTTFNVVQENAVKGGLTGMRAGRRSTSREIRGIDDNIKLNRGLWLLGAEMARLKSAA
jgi:hypothetical protein